MGAEIIVFQRKYVKFTLKQGHILRTVSQFLQYLRILMQQDKTPFEYAMEVASLNLVVDIFGRVQCLDTRKVISWLEQCIVRPYLECAIEANSPNTVANGDHWQKVECPTTRPLPERRSIQSDLFLVFKAKYKIDVSPLDFFPHTPWPELRRHTSRRQQEPSRPRSCMLWYPLSCHPQCLSLRVSLFCNSR